MGGVYSWLGHIVVREFEYFSPTSGWSGARPRPQMDTGGKDGSPSLDPGTPGWTRHHCLSPQMQSGKPLISFISCCSPTQMLCELGNRSPFLQVRGLRSESRAA